MDLLLEAKPGCEVTTGPEETIEQEERLVSFPNFLQTDGVI